MLAATLFTGVVDPPLSAWRRSRICDDGTMGGTMRLDRDFSEFVGLLRAHKVRFLIVGGYAVALHGHPRYTGDLDVWLMVDTANVDRLLAALDDFGFGSVGLSADDFLRPDQVVQLGYPPLRIDLLTGLDGVKFADCYANRVEVDLGAVTAPFISLPDLRRNKAASGRPQDLADLQALAD